MRGRNATANTSETAPRPSPGADIVSRAREERARHLASGQPLDEWVGRSKPPAPVQNLLIGMSEAGRNTARADAMLRDFSRTAEAHPDMPHADIAADVVEAMRAGKEVTPDAAKAAAPTTSDPAAALIAERAQAVEASQPDLVVGADADGKPITASEAMAQARREAATGTDSTLGVDDADLLRVAANCHLQTGD